MSICHSRKGGGGCREQASVDSGSTLWVSRIVAHTLYFLHNQHLLNTYRQIKHFAHFVDHRLLHIGDVLLFQIL